MKENQEKIIWHKLSRNHNPDAMLLLKEHLKDFNIIDINADDGLRRWMRISFFLDEVIKYTLDLKFLSHEIIEKAFNNWNMIEVVELIKRYFEIWQYNHKFLYNYQTACGQHCRHKIYIMVMISLRLLLTTSILSCMITNMTNWWFLKTEPVTLYRIQHYFDREYAVAWWEIKNQIVKIYK
mgnify:CR=1 FL=1